MKQEELNDFINDLLEKKGRGELDINDMPVVIEGVMKIFANFDDKKPKGSSYKNLVKSGFDFSNLLQELQVKLQEHTETFLNELGVDEKEFQELLVESGKNFDKDESELLEEVNKINAKAKQLNEDIEDHKESPKINSKRGGWLAS